MPVLLMLENRMKPKSLQLNFFLNTSRTVLNVLIPFVTFPYISRVLGPSGTGKVDFVNSIVSYFVLFTELGISNYGAREVARVRDNKLMLSTVVYELTLILLMTVCIGYALYAALVLAVPSFREQWLLFCVVSPTIALSDFSYEWFYQGMEEQTYITSRYLFVKLLQVSFIFLFIKDASHFVRYAAMFVGLNAVSSVFNIFHLRKFLQKVPVSGLKPFRHLKTLFIVFGSLVATNIYTHLDVTMLGILLSDEEVGLYTAANKLVRIVISLVTALSAVVVPRMENCLACGDFDGYRHYINVSLHYILILAFPCCLGLLALAPDIITIFAGEKYAHSVLTIKILAPVVVIVGLAYFVGLQVLYPHRQEWKYTVSVSVAAVSNFIFNLFMIPRLAHDGAALGSVLAELVGLVIQVGFAWKYLRETDLLSLNSLKYLVSSLVMFCAIKFIPDFNANVGLHCGLCFVMAVIVYGISLFLLKEKTVRSLFKRNPR